MSIYEGAIEPEQLLELLRHRQSERAYEPDRRIPRELLLRLIEAARVAPSALNEQPWHYIVVDEPELRAQMAQAAAGRIIHLNHYAHQCSAIIAVVQRAASAGAKAGGIVQGVTYPPYDVGLSVSQLCLQAVAEGLGTCIVGLFDKGKVRSLLGIPKGLQIPLLITVGYPTDPHREKRRRDIYETASWNGWGRTLEEGEEA